MVMTLTLDHPAKAVQATLVPLGTGVPSWGWTTSGGTVWTRNQQGEIDDPNEPPFNVGTNNYKSDKIVSLTFENCTPTAITATT